MRYYGASATRISGRRRHLHGVGRGNLARSALERVPIAVERALDPAEIGHRLPAYRADDFDCRSDIVAHSAIMRVMDGSNNEKSMELLTMAPQFKAPPKPPAVDYLVRLHADIGGRILENQK